MNNSQAMISIKPNISKIDDVVDIKLYNFPKNKRVTIRAVSRDFYCINAPIRKVGKNTIWESYGTFITDEHGNIDLENQVPINGNYKTRDKMGLFYSMKIKETHVDEVPEDLRQIKENREYTITFTAEVDGKVIVSQNHKRIYCDDTIVSTNVVEENLVARYFTSKNKMKRPAVIVLSGSDGRIEKAQAIAELLAMKGYSALAVCYFGLNGTPKQLSRIPLEYIENAINWLKKSDTVNKDKISIYGRSKGGEMVLLAGSLFKDISCVIANTPSCYVYEGITKDLISSHSSWTYKGCEIPCISFGVICKMQLGIKMLLKNKAPFRWMYEKAAASSNTDKAAIAAERINGPVLMISSASDAIWPSKRHCEISMERLKKAKFKYEYKHCTYENSGHALTLPYEPNPMLKEYGGNMEDCAKGVIDAWNETIAFLKKWSC